MYSSVATYHVYSLVTVKINIATVLSCRRVTTRSFLSSDCGRSMVKMKRRLLRNMEWEADMDMGKTVGYQSVSH